MLHLPRTVEVHVQHEGGSPAISILVSLDLHHAGRYYYGTHVGLTDTAGIASISKTLIEQAFEEDRAMFMMDYRVPLSDCDPEAVIRVIGGGDFVAQRPLPD